MNLPPSSLLTLCLILPQLAGAAAAEIYTLRLCEQCSAVRACPQGPPAMLVLRPFKLVAAAGGIMLARRPVKVVAAAGDIRGRFLERARPQHSLGVLRAAEFRAQFFTGSNAGSRRDKKNCKVVFTQQELRNRLTPLQYHVTQEKGTESAFAGEYTHQTDKGTYKCVVCGTALFKSETKFDSSSGWPSFYDVIGLDTITFTDDFSYGMHRVETSCSQCGAHLGHLFDDGPRPTGKRYCINSASLSFVPEDLTSVDGSSGSSSSSPTVTEKKEL